MCYLDRNLRSISVEIVGKRPVCSQFVVEVVQNLMFLYGERALGQRRQQWTHCVRLISPNRSSGEAEDPRPSAGCKLDS